MKVILKLEAVTPVKFATFCAFVDGCEKEFREEIQKMMAPAEVSFPQDYCQVVKLLKSSSFEVHDMTLMVVEIAVRSLVFPQLVLDGKSTEVAIRVPMRIINKIFGIISSFDPGQDFVSITNYESRSQLL